MCPLPARPAFSISTYSVFTPAWHQPLREAVIVDAVIAALAVQNEHGNVLQVLQLACGLAAARNTRPCRAADLSSNSICRSDGAAAAGSYVIGLFAMPQLGRRYRRRFEIRQLRVVDVLDRWRRRARPSRSPSPGSDARSAISQPNAPPCECVQQDDRRADHVEQRDVRVARQLS